MKRFVLLIITLSFGIIGYAQAVIRPIQVTKEQALTWAKMQYAFPSSVDFYIGTKNLREGEISFIGNECWYIFVDEEPMKGWEHKCTGMYIQKSSLSALDRISIAKIENLTMPPSDIELEPIDVKNRYGNNVNYKLRVPINTDKNGIDEDAEHTYAVILSGGANKYSNYHRYWNDCSYIYQTLRNRYRIPKENIIPIMADGSDPAADMLDLSTMQFKSSPTDLDLDGVQDLYYAATKANVNNVFLELARKLTPNDHLFIYVIDHGGSKDGVSQSYICLWNNEQLQDAELASMLDRFNVRGISAVLGQCYAGGFIDNLQKPGRVISAACTGSESSYACTDIAYDEFVFQWTKAMNIKPKLGEVVFPDINANEKISMAEAFNYAKTNDRRIDMENPMYSSMNESFGEELGFDSIPRLYSLFMRDNIEDNGIKPSTGYVCWDTPDVWVRNQDDGFENQTSEAIKVDSNIKNVYVYMRVNNRGLSEYTNKDTLFLTSFWADAALSISPKVWLGMTTGNDGTTVGDRIQSFRLSPNIQTGKSAIVEMGWSLPVDIIEKAKSGYSHHCLLVYLSKTRTNDYDATKRLLDVLKDVKKSNKIVQKNLSVVYSSNKGTNNIPLDVRNVASTDRPYTIEIMNDPYTDKKLLEEAELSVTLSNSLYNLWKEGGMVAENVTSYSSNPNKLYLRGDDSKICNLGLAKDQVDDIQVECNFLASKWLSIYPDTFKIHLVQRDAVTGEIVGGEAFEVIRLPRLIEGELKPRIDEEFTGYGLKTLSAQNINEEVTYEWIDENNTSLGTGKTLNVPAGTSGEIKLRVQAVSDGAVSYATVNIAKSQKILEVSPLPFSSSVLVKLSYQSTGQTVLRLTSVSGGVSMDYPVTEGESEVSIFTSQLQNGIYTLSLIENGKVIDSKNITKK